MRFVDTNILLYAVSTQAAGATKAAKAQAVLLSRDLLSAVEGEHWKISAGPYHWQIFSGLIQQCQVTGNFVSDAHLAALAMEHNIEPASGDVDFAKFSGLRWINPTTI